VAKEGRGRKSSEEKGREGGKKRRQERKGRGGRRGLTRCFVEGLRDASAGVTPALESGCTIKPRTDRLRFLRE